VKGVIRFSRLRGGVEKGGSRGKKKESNKIKKVPWGGVLLCENGRGEANGYEELRGPRRERGANRKKSGG